MTEEVEKTNRLRRILLQVKEHAAEEDLQDIELFDKCLGALADIGKNQIDELQQEVYDLLSVKDEIIRGEVVATLGYSTRLALPEFQLNAYDIWLNDPSDDVKRRALSCWIDYYMNSKDQNVIKILYNIFSCNNNDYSIRECAYDGILSTVDYHGLCVKWWDYNFKIPTNNIEFDDLIDWKKLNKVLLKYAPEVLHNRETTDKHQSKASLEYKIEAYGVIKVFIKNAFDSLKNVTLKLWCYAKNL